MCARFLSHLLLLYIGRVHGAISGCTVLGEVHPASAQNESLISDTAPTIPRKRVCRILCVQQLSRADVGITVKHCCLWEQNLVFAAVL